MSCTLKGVSFKVICGNACSRYPLSDINSFDRIANHYITGPMNSQELLHYSVPATVTRNRLAERN